MTDQSPEADVPRSRRRPAAAALAAVLLALAGGVPASAAIPLVSMSIRVAPNPMAPGESVIYYGYITPVRGTPTNVRVHMEIGPGGWPAGTTCWPTLYCEPGGGTAWVFASLSTTRVVKVVSTGIPDRTVRFYLDGGTAGCTGSCPPSVTTVGATPTTSMTWTVDDQVTTGATIHVTARGSTNAGPLEGDLQVALPDGVDAPSNLPPGAMYSPPPAHYVDFVQTLDPSATYTFDVVIAAPAGSILPFDVNFFPSAGSVSIAQSTTSVKVGADATKPTATGPKWTLVTNSAIDANGRIPVRLSWTGSDGGSGIERYQVARSTDGGAYVAEPVEPTGATLTRSLSASHAYRFRVRPIDHAGNVGSWVYGGPFTLTAYSEASGTIDYGGTWGTVTSSAYRGGTAKTTTSSGKSATQRVSSRSIGWLAPKGPTMGKAKVYVDGTYVATVDLWAPDVLPQRLVWTRSWSTTAVRTVRIVALGTIGMPRITLDGIITLR